MPYQKLGEIGDSLGTDPAQTIGPIILRDSMMLEEGAAILSQNFVSGSTGFAILYDGTVEFRAGSIGALSVVDALTLTSGGKIRSAASGERIEITNSADTATDRIYFYTGHVDEVTPGKLYGSNSETGGGRLWMGLRAPDPGTGGGATYIGLFSPTDDNSTNGSQVLFGYDGSLTGVTPQMKLQNNMILMVEDGSSSAPSITFNNDWDTGFYRVSSNALGIVAGATEMLRLTSTGMTVYGAFSSRTIAPVSDNTYALGSASSYRYANVYMVGGTGAAGTDININASTGQLYQVTSSKRYKKNIKPYRSGLDMLLALRPVNFQWRKGKSDAGYDDSFIDLGLIAEEVAEVAPEFVVFNKDGEPESVRYSSLVIPLINAVRELADEVDRLRSVVVYR